VLELSETLRCPNCGSRDVRVSHSRRALDAILRIFHRVPIRCRQCQNRFYIYGAALEDAEDDDKPQESKAE